MQILRKARIQVGLVTILLASVWGTYVTSAAQAEEIKPTVYAEWKDPSSGSTYYNWSGSDGEKYTNKVIVSTNDGKWAQLNDKFARISTDYSKLSSYPELSIDFSNASAVDLFDYINPLYLDTTAQAAVRGLNYDISPDGKWGLYRTSNFGAEMSANGKSVYSTKLHSYFLKNMATGEIQEWISSLRSVTVYWLADSKLLVAQYSPEAKQKEISTYDPATGETKQLVLGTLYVYSDKEQKLLFTKNEPWRIPWVYDLKTGRSSLATKTEQENLYAWIDPRPTTKAPDNLDMKTLPVIDLPIHRLYEHEVMTSQGSELVPFTFVKDGEKYIPLHSLVSKFSLSIGLREGNMYDYQYKLTGASDQTVILDRNNSYMFQFRLYVTPEVLEKVGLEDVTVRTDMKGVIK
ncbi:hypothetical protein ACP8HI_16920 [Paenibacillus sp. FA6]|uniref:hypothetical protein n=1 Tax=Paenibacillus sp. FA6 TaxID=3413029 RepID=UPI003F655E23